MPDSVILRDAVANALPSAGLNAPPSPFLGILPPDMWNRNKRTMLIPINVLALAPNGTTGQASVRADINHDYVGFVACVKTRTTDAAHTAVTDMPILCTIAMEDGTQFQPTSGVSGGSAGTQNELDNLFGSAKQPAIWPIPLIIPAGQAAVFTFTNNHNANTLDIRATLIGFAVDH